MKTSLKLFLTVVLSCFLLLAVFNIGFYLGKEESKKEVYEVQNDVADRYLKQIGSPKTLQQHCTFIEVVYGDFTECK